MFVLGTPVVVNEPNLRLNWTAANDECRSRGMNLMTLETEEKHNLLYQLHKDIGECSKVSASNKYSQKKMEVHGLACDTGN